MKKIVIAEDEYFVRCGIANGIDWEQHGFQIAGIAENGEQALALVRCYLPDVLITDIRMPVMDGLSLIREAKKIRSTLKIIILTAYSDFEYAQEAIQLGVNDYVLKLSAKPKDILQRIQKLFGSETAEASSYSVPQFDKPYCVAAICIPNNMGQEKKKFIAHCAKYLQEQCGELDRNFLTCIEDGIAYLICFLHQDMLIKLLNRLLYFIRDTYEIELMVGVSPACRDEEELFEGKRMARNACDYNFYQTGGQVTPYREGILTPFRFSVSENEVRKAMESRNDDEPHQLLDRLLKKLQFTSVSDCKSTCIDFLYQVV